MFPPRTCQSYKLPEVIWSCCYHLTVLTLSCFIMHWLERFNRQNPRCVHRRSTLHVSEVPRAFHEPAILNGYRPCNRPWRYYFASLFHIHNETLNIWTHLIATGILGKILHDCISEYGINDKHVGQMVIFLITAMCCSILSSVTHLLHSKSVYIHYTVVMMDYIGVNLYMCGSGVITFYSFWDKAWYEVFEPYILPLMVLVPWTNFMLCCCAKITFGEGQSSINKMLTGTTMLFATIFYVPVLCRLSNCFHAPECSVTTLKHLIICPIMLLVQAFFFGSHLPEKLMPGKCDIIGQGHQFFHVTITITQIMQIRAVQNDYRIGALHHSNPNFWHLLVATFALVLLNVTTLLCILKFIKVSVNDKKA